VANDQPQEIKVQAPNGDRVAVQIGSKGFALTTKDLVTVLLIVGMAVGFYLAVLSLSTNQARGFSGLERILDHMGTNQAAFLDKLATSQGVFVDKLTTMQTVVLERFAADRAHTDEILVRQNQQVNDQTAALQRLVDEQTSTIRKMLIMLNWNLGHPPTEQLPIEWDPAQLPPVERGR
jgi:hypothetical protein